MTTNNSVNSPLSGTTGTGNFVGSISPSIASPSITTNINDVNSTTWIGQTANTGAVNYLVIANNSTGNAPALNSSGSDTNISMILSCKGTGGVSLKGVGTNAVASSGFVGEFVSSVIASGSATSLTNSTAKDVTSISLTAGDWDIFGNIYVTGAAANLAAVAGWISTTSATAPDISLYNQVAANTGTFDSIGLSAPTISLQLSTTTTVYLSASATFGGGSATACGGIYARRRR